MDDDGRFLIAFSASHFAPFFFFDICSFVHPLDTWTYFPFSPTYRGMPNSGQDQSGKMLGCGVGGKERPHCPMGIYFALFVWRLSILIS